MLCEDWRRGARIPVIAPFLACLDRELVKINISENKEKKEAIELDDKLYISDKVEKEDKNSQSLQFMSLLEIMKKLGKGTMREQNSAFGNKVKVSFRKEECEMKENERPD